MDLKFIFDAITPENIKDIPLIRDAMAIFIENLEENSNISSDIKNIFQNVYKPDDSDFLEESKLKLRAALLDTYLTAMYQVLGKAQNNELIRAKLEQNGLTEIPFVNDLEKTLTNEYFLTSKKFKEKLGTTTAIDYAYNLAKFLEDSDNTDVLQVQEVEPFKIHVNGAILQEMYEYIVKPLSHPVGFVYDYYQIVKESINDLYGVDQIYIINSIEVRNIDGSFDAFTPDADDTNVLADFLTRINPLTGELFTEAEFYEQVTVHYNKVTKKFVDTYQDVRNLRSVLFEDGTYLQQYTNPLEILYLTYSDYKNGNYDNVIKDFSGHNSLYVDYDEDIVFQYYDDEEKIYETFYISKVREEGAEELFYSSEDPSKAFHIGGSEYIYIPGQDESMYKYNDTVAIQDVISNAFTVTVTGSAQYTNQNVIVRITDDYNSYVEGVALTDGSGDFTVDLCTYKLQGTVYTLHASFERDEYTAEFQYRTTCLNIFDVPFKFMEIKTLTTDVLTISGVGPAGYELNLKISDGTNEINTTTDIDSSGNFSTDVDVQALIKGDFRIDSLIYETNGKIKCEYFFEGNFLVSDFDTLQIYCNIFSYGAAPDYTGVTDRTAISTSEIPGINTSDTYVKKKIGELMDGTYAPEDISIRKYISYNSLTSMEEIPDGTIFNGAYIEGNNYSTSYYDYVHDETFINIGRDINDIDTSDFIIMTEEDFVQEEFIAYILSKDGYYLFSEDVDLDFYFVSTDEFYLSVRPNATV